tara:strand:+ start:172 stop:942 length:771 start_codon:yes stop_codon:yes gene_type:complete
MRPSPRALEQREKQQLQNVRNQFFKGANSNQVSDDRAFRRLTQDRGEQSFKNQYTKPVSGSSNLLQMTPDAPRTLAQERMRLANLYGPTPREVMGDIGRGIGSIFSGIAERGTPMMQLIKTARSGIMDFFSPKTPVSTMGQGPSYSIGTQFLPADFASQVQSRTTGQAPFPGLQTGPMMNMQNNQTQMAGSSMFGNQSLDNLTAFGQSLSQRIKSDRPGISDDDLLQVLQRSHRAGMSGMGNPVFFMADGGITTLQ